MKKTFCSLMAGLMLCAAPVMFPAHASAEGLAITATAGPVAGTGYIGMGALGKFYSDTNSGASVTMLPGSDVSNPIRLEKGEVDVAIETACLAVCARDGAAPFKKAVGNLSAVANLRTISRMNIVVRADTGITSLEQLKAEKRPIRLATGPRGSASEVMGRWVLEEYGITYKDITSWGGKLISNNFGDAADLAKDGQVDMIFWGGPGEAWFFTDLITNTPLRWLPVNDEVAAKVNEKYMLAPAKFEASEYNGKMGQDVPTVHTSLEILVRSDLSEDIVYRLTKAMCEGADEIIAANPTWGNFKQENAFEGVTHPLHPGAVKYYKEKGWLK